MHLPQRGSDRDDAVVDQHLDQLFHVEGVAFGVAHHQLPHRLHGLRLAGQPADSHKDLEALDAVHVPAGVGRAEERCAFAGAQLRLDDVDASADGRKEPARHERPDLRTADAELHR